MLERLTLSEIVPLLEEPASSNGWVIEDIVRSPDVRDRIIAVCSKSAVYKQQGRYLTARVSSASESGKLCFTSGHYDFKTYELAYDDAVDRARIERLPDYYTAKAQELVENILREKKRYFDVWGVVPNSGDTEFTGSIGRLVVIEYRSREIDYELWEVTFYQGGDEHIKNDIKNGTYAIVAVTYPDDNRLLGWKDFHYDLMDAPAPIGWHGGAYEEVK